MLTACNKTDEIVAGLDAGADDYLSKPFDFDELLARIRVGLRRHGGALPKIVVGDLSFDPRIRDVSVRGKSVILHGRELTLLEVLMRHADRMVSRQTLLDESTAPTTTFSRRRLTCWCCACGGPWRSTARASKFTRRAASAT